MAGPPSIYAWGGSRPCWLGGRRVRADFPLREGPINRYDLRRRLLVEWLGTAFLLAVVVGSGIMGERLAFGNDAVALLGNTIATGAILVVLILIFGPVSGAHFNPAVTLSFALQGKISGSDAARYVLTQILGALCGVLIAHLMFAEPWLAASTHTRTGAGPFSSRI